MNTLDHNPTRIVKADKEFAKKLDFKNMKFPVKSQDIYKIEKKIPSTLVFLAIKIRKNIQFVYQINAVKKTMLTYY